MRGVAIAAGLAALIAAPPALAQDDLQSRIDTELAPFSEVENIGILMRCTALFRALQLSVGAETELGAEAIEREGYMASLAGVLWMDSDASTAETPAEVFDVLIPPINAVTDHYLSHMAALIEAEGVPFDDTIIGHAEFCNGVYDTLQDTGE